MGDIDRTYYTQRAGSGLRSGARAIVSRELTRHLRDAQGHGVSGCGGRRPRIPNLYGHSLPRHEQVVTFEFRVDALRQWDEFENEEGPHRNYVTGDVFLRVRSERVREDYFPGSMGFELTGTVVSLWRHACELWHRGDHAGWLFHCGGCANDGCTKLYWQAWRDQGVVEFQIEGGGDLFFDEPVAVAEFVYFDAIADLVAVLPEYVQSEDVPMEAVPPFRWAGVDSPTDLRTVERRIRARDLPTDPDELG